MKVVGYLDEDKKEKRAVDVESLLADMDSAELINGTYNAEKVAELYYRLKSDLTNALYAELEKPKKK